MHLLVDVYTFWQALGLKNELMQWRNHQQGLIPAPEHQFQKNAQSRCTEIQIQEL